MPIHYSYVGKILQCDFLSPDQQSALQRNPLRKDPGPNAYKEALRFSKASGVMEYMKLDRPPPPLGEILVMHLPCLKQWERINTRWWILKHTMKWREAIFVFHFSHFHFVWSLFNLSSKALHTFYLLWWNLVCIPHIHRLYVKKGKTGWTTEFASKMESNFCLLLSRFSKFWFHDVLFKGFKLIRFILVHQKMSCKHGHVRRIFCT